MTTGKSDITTGDNIVLQDSFIADKFKKYLNAIQKKGKQIHMKLTKEIKKSLKSIKSFATMCTTDLSIEVQNEQIRQPNDLPIEDKDKPMISQPEETLEKVIREEEAEFTETLTFLDEQNRLLDVTEEFISEMQSIIEQTAHMRNTVHIAIVLFFYLVHNKYTITQTLQKKEQEYHNSETEETADTDRMGGMSNELVVCLVIQCMQLSSATNCLLEHREKLKEAYFLLQATIITFLVDRKKNSQHSKEGIMFCIAVAEYIRDTVEANLGGEKRVEKQ